VQITHIVYILGQFWCKLTTAAERTKASVVTHTGAGSNPAMGGIFLRAVAAWYPERGAAIPHPGMADTFFFCVVSRRYKGALHSWWAVLPPVSVLYICNMKMNNIQNKRFRASLNKKRGLYPSNISPSAHKLTILTIDLLTGLSPHSSSLQRLNSAHDSLPQPRRR